MSKWYDSENPSTLARGGTWRVMVWIIAVVVFVLLLSLALWGFGVFTSPLKGRGDAYKQQQSSTNRIAAQARFEDLIADIKATDAKLLTAKKAVKTDPGNQILQTNFTGLTNYCLDIVGDYNAESRKYLAKDFKAWDLPGQIDRTSPETDCKP